MSKIIDKKNEYKHTSLKEIASISKLIIETETIIKNKIVKLIL